MRERPSEMPVAHSPGPLPDGADYLTKARYAEAEETIMQQATRQTYLHGYSDEHRAFLASRTAARDAAFFVPYLKRGMRLLDCGCGMGALTVSLAEVVAPGEVTGIDWEPSQIDAAQAWAAERGATNVRFQTGSIYDLPFPDGSFDAVFANTVLEHTSDPQRIIREMYRVLAPGGVAGVCDPDYATLIHAPATPLSDEGMSLMLKVDEHNGGSLYYARHQRSYLIEAGFARTEGFAQAGADGSLEGTRAAFDLVIKPTFRAPGFESTAIELGWADRDRLDAIVAELEAWSRREDAFFALIQCAAIGWKE